MNIEAVYFDGKVARAQPVRLSTIDGYLLVERADDTLQYPISEVQVQEPIGSGPRVLALADLGRLEIVAQQGMDTFLDSLNYREGLVVRIQSNWKIATFSTFLIVCFGVIFYLKGLPLVSSTLAQKVPLTALDALDQRSFESLDQNLFAKSEVSASRQARIREQFADLVSLLRTNPDLAIPDELEYQLEFRRFSDIPNAMALPAGTLILLDGLVLELTDAEVLAVLCHELGHVVHRHALTQIVRSSLIGLAFAFTVGDFSFIGSSIVLGVADLAMNRDMERQADEFSVRAFASAGESLEPLLNVHEKLMELTGDSDQEAGRVQGYFRSHPPGQERRANMKALWQSLHPGAAGAD